MPESPSVTPAGDRDDGPTVIRHPDPIAAAGALAAEDGGSVAGAVDRERLDQLHDAMRRAEAVLERTRAQVVDGLARSLEVSLTIHPDTIRRASATALRAEEALARARVGDPPGPAHGRRAWSAIGVVAVAVGIAMSVGFSVSAGLALIGAGAGTALVATSLVRRRHRRMVPARRADRDLARQRWQQVAGRDVEPEELDRVLHRYDPQLETVARLASDHPAVRAASRAVEDRRRAWVRAWAAAVAPPGEAARPDADAAADDPATEVVVTDRPRTDPVPPAVLVLVAPDEGLPDDEARRLRGDLRRLHDPGVVVVVGTGEAAPDDAITIDLRRPRNAAPDPDADPAVRLA